MKLPIRSLGWILMSCCLVVFGCHGVASFVPNTPTVVRDVWVVNRPTENHPADASAGRNDNFYSHRMNTFVNSTVAEAASPLTKNEVAGDMRAVPNSHTHQGFVAYDYGNQETVLATTEVYLVENTVQQDLLTNQFKYLIQQHEHGRKGRNKQSNNIDDNENDMLRGLQFWSLYKSVNGLKVAHVMEWDTMDNYQRARCDWQIWIYEYTTCHVAVQGIQPYFRTRRITDSGTNTSSTTSNSPRDPAAPWLVIRHDPNEPPNTVRVCPTKRPANSSPRNRFYASTVLEQFKTQPGHSNYDDNRIYYSGSVDPTTLEEAEQDLYELVYSTAWNASRK